MFTPTLFLKLQGNFLCPTVGFAHILFEGQLSFCTLKWQTRFVVIQEVPHSVTVITKISQLHFSGPAAAAPVP